MDITISQIHQIYLYQTDRKTWKSIPDRAFHILSYQLEGHYDHRFSFGTLPIMADTLFLINQQSDYSVKCISGGSSICVSFSGTSDFDTMAINCQDNPRIRNLFKRLVTLKNLNLSSNRYNAFSILYEILAFISEKNETELFAGNTRSEVQKLHDLLTTHYTEQGFNIYQAANESGIGEKNFRNIFKKLYGTTPTQYQIDLRLKMAAELLSDGALSVSAISEMTGFSDIYYFSKLFKQHFSVSPGKYRISQHPADTE